MTVADLIKIYEGKKIIDNPEEKTYQWNNFVRDFNKDLNTIIIKQDHMKVAAQLWKQVRDSSGQKKYSTRLLEEYLNQLKE